MEYYLLIGVLFAVFINLASGKADIITSICLILFWPLGVLGLLIGAGREN